MKHSKPAETLIAAIGEDALIDNFGLTARNLRHVRSTGQFAAHWYIPIKKYAESRGINCPPEAFYWKSPANKGGDHSTEIKGQASK